MKHTQPIYNQAMENEFPWNCPFLIYLPDKDKPFKDIKRSAKHEALHLLLQRLEHRAQCRYVAEEEIYEAVEELVFKLEELIDG